MRRRRNASGCAASATRCWPARSPSSAMYAWPARPAERAFFRKIWTPPCRTSSTCCNGAVAPWSVSRRRPWAARSPVRPSARAHPVPWASSSGCCWKLPAGASTRVWCPASPPCALIRLWSPSSHIRTRTVVTASRWPSSPAIPSSMASACPTCAGALPICSATGGCSTAMITTWWWTPIRCTPDWGSAPAPATSTIRIPR